MRFIALPLIIREFPVWGQDFLYIFDGLFLIRRQFVAHNQGCNRVFHLRLFAAQGCNALENAKRHTVALAAFQNRDQPAMRIFVSHEAARHKGWP